MALLRFAVSRAATLRPDGMRRKIMILDAKRAFLHAEAIGKTYVAPPHLRGTKRCWLLKKCMYGTLPAAAGWQKHVGHVMTAMGTQPCDGSPCAFYDKAKDLLIVVYGDDFVVVGLGDVLLNFETELATHLSMTRKAFIGHDEGDDKCGRVLNRIISLEDDGLHWEADRDTRS